MNKIFGLNFFSKNRNDLVVNLTDEILNGNKVTVFTPNVDHIINNYIQCGVFDYYAKSEYIIADGWPLVAISRLKKQRIERITGVDLMDSLLELADENKYNVFFLGSNEETLKKLKKNIRSEYPNIQNIGCHHGYFDKNEEVINKINENKTQILFVGMGNPKQEIWLRTNLNLLNINIGVGVGGALNIFSKDVERAPKWIQNIGMEWFYRFIKEPKRLFTRYFIKYPKFIKYAMQEVLSNE